MENLWPDIKLNDDGKKNPFSVYAYAQKLDIDPCGYGATEVEALEQLIDKMDEDICVLQEAKAAVTAMLNERRPR